MNDPCTHAQEALAEGGVDRLPLGLKEHVAGCEACSAVLLGLNALDAELGAWPVPPMPEGLAARVEQAVQDATLADSLEEDEPVSRPGRRWSGPRLAGIAAALMLVAGTGALLLEARSKVRGLFETADAEIDTIDSNLGGPSGWVPARSKAPTVVAEAGRLDRESDEWRAMDPDGDGMRRPAGGGSGANLGQVFRPRERLRVQKKRDRGPSVSINSPAGGSGRRRTVEDAAKSPPPEPRIDEPKAAAPVQAQPMDSSRGLGGVERPSEETATERANRAPAEDQGRGLLALIGETENTDPLEGLLEKDGHLLADVQDALARGRRSRDLPRRGAGGSLDEHGPPAWVGDRTALDVPTVPAEGYWANPYVPGDPALRRLEAQVRDQRSELRSSTFDLDGLDLLARQVRQPFDPPTDGALDVYLHADRRGIIEPTRLRIQVGLQGTTRRSGRRPTMNVALVLDLRGTTSAEVDGAMEALAQALAQARDLGDAFSLVIAGRPGGEVVPAGSFRYGPVRLAMEAALGDGGEGPTLDLPAAMRRGIAAAGATDDPNRPLGSTLVLLASPGDLGREGRVVEELARRSAVAGVPVSVVAVGSRADVAGLEAVALAGQGSRRILGDASDAAGVVDRELSAASRVVARAVRLRIRLAPGVRLVEVLGSHRLGARRRRQVKEAEESIDLRLARNLGIQADRGEDEEGIQIVIPAWYSGDGHAILLDVIAPGPGPIADVSVKYKDLVRLDNGVARASLTLGRDPRPPGPLELNVLKNELAHGLSTRLAAAAEGLRAGSTADAAEGVRAADAWLRAVQWEIPGLFGDRELARDHDMLAAYARVLEVTSDPRRRRFLDESLRLAARRKVLAPLPDDPEGAP